MVGLEVEQDNDEAKEVLQSSLKREYALKTLTEIEIL